jgi:hypothetical protein
VLRWRGDPRGLEPMRIHSVRKNQDWTARWKQSIAVTLYRKDRPNCSHCRGVFNCGTEHRPQATGHRPQVVLPLQSLQHLMELEGSVPHSQELSTCASTEPHQSPFVATVVDFTHIRKQYLPLSKWIHTYIHTYSSTPLYKSWHTFLNALVQITNEIRLQIKTFILK